MKPTINNLTLGERILVLRRRHSYTQRDVSGLLRLPRRTVQELEADTHTGVVDDRVRKWADLRERFHDHEKCFVARHRAGESVNTTAKALKVSRQWLNEMESGREDCAPLVAYWGL